MTIVLPSAVYTAGHGYGWSSTPDGLDMKTLDDLLSDARATRPDFAEADAVSAGLVVRSGTAAAFTIRRAIAWDAVGRDADYAAFVFVPCTQADAVDFAALLADDFFRTPTRTPPAALTYDGPSSHDFPLDAPGRLLCQNRLEGFDPRAAGALLSRYGAKADRWLFQTDPTGAFTVTTTPWHR